MVSTQPRYGTFMIVARIVEFFAWCVVLIGVVMAIGGLATGGILGAVTRSFGQSHNIEPLVRIVASIPGFATALGGLVIVLVVQYQKATVESTRMTGELLRIAYRQEFAQFGDIEEPKKEDVGEIVWA